MRSVLASLLGAGLFIAVAFGWQAPASAQGPQFFYCYAVDAKAGRVYLSDTHRVGPVAERRTYGEGFSAYLAKQGKVPAGTAAYCVMRARAEDIERAQLDLSVQNCLECGSASKFEQVAWQRNGKTGTMLDTKLPQRQGSASKADSAGSAEAVVGEGVHILVREDSRGLLLSLNEKGGRTLVRQKALAKGGKWRFLAEDDRCAGWMSVTYATDGTKTHYFLARGAESADVANSAARGSADAWTKRQQGTWITGQLASFRNDYEPGGADFSKGVIDGVKKEVRRLVTSDCGESPTYTTMGVRG